VDAALETDAVTHTPSHPTRDVGFSVEGLAAAMEMTVCSPTSMTGMAAKAMTGEMIGKIIAAEKVVAKEVMTGEMMGTTTATEKVVEREMMRKTTATEKVVAREALGITMAEARANLEAILAKSRSSYKFSSDLILMVMELSSGKN